MEKWYSLNETANLLGIKVRTVRKWVHDGKLHASKYPQSRRWFVTETEIQRLRGQANDNKD